MKKAVNYADQQKKKAGKEKELALRVAKEQEEREKTIAAAKSIVITEDKSLPEAKAIILDDTRPELKDTRVKVTGMLATSSGGRTITDEKRSRTSSTPAEGASVHYFTRWLRVHAMRPHWQPC